MWLNLRATTKGQMACLDSVSVCLNQTDLSLFLILTSGKEYHSQAGSTTFAVSQYLKLKLVQFLMYCSFTSICQRSSVSNIGLFGEQASQQMPNRLSQEITKLLACSLCYKSKYHAVSSPDHEETKSDTLWAVFQGQGSVVVVVFRLDWGVVQHRGQQVHLPDFIQGG